jgi:hypothetical protein
MLTVLDPRFNYKKLRKDYAGDHDLLKYLEEQKKELRAYFDEHYPASESSSNSSARATTTSNTFGARAGPINFAAFDQGSDDEGDADELNTYFDAPRVPLHTDPVQWWYARKAEYPRLYRFARDIMSIPVSFSYSSTPELRLIFGTGSAVAVERVFSGGRDTISLRRSRLKPETIRTLMVLKHHLRLKRKTLENLVDDAKAAEGRVDT